MKDYAVTAKGRKFVICKYRHYMVMQRREVRSPLNRWGTGKDRGHKPTEEECWIYWGKCGAAARYADYHWDEYIEKGVIRQVITIEMEEPLMVQVA